MPKLTISLSKDNIKRLEKQCPEKQTLEKFIANMTIYGFDEFVLRGLERRGL